MKKESAPFSKMFFWRRVSSRPPNEDECFVVNLLKDIATVLPLQITPQTQVVTGSSKFSSCVFIYAPDDTGHWRNELNIAVVRRLSGAVNQEPEFVYEGNPSMRTLRLPSSCDLEQSRNALYAFMLNQLQSWLLGLTREMATYAFFEKGVFRVGDEWISVVDIRYATPEEDTGKGWDIVLHLSSMNGARMAPVQVTGSYKDQEEKNHELVGLVRYGNNYQQPSEEAVIKFLLGLYDRKPKQELCLPQR